VQPLDATTIAASVARVPSWSGLRCIMTRLSSRKGENPHPEVGGR
jgi:hypothetical protein